MEAQLSVSGGCFRSCDAEAQISHGRTKEPFGARPPKFCIILLHSNGLQDDLLPPRNTTWERVCGRSRTPTAGQPPEHGTIATAGNRSRQVDQPVPSQMPTPKVCQWCGTCLRLSMSDDSSGNSREAFESHVNSTTDGMCRPVNLVQHLDLVRGRLAHPQNLRNFWGLFNHHSYESKFERWNSSTSQKSTCAEVPFLPVPRWPNPGGQMADEWPNPGMQS